MTTNTIIFRGDEYLNTKFISAVMVLVVTFSFGYTTVHADVASDKAKIQQVQAQRNDLENKIMVMDNQIETIMFKINDNESNITKTQNNIQQSQIDIAKA
jgi:peptidoglycan hydrolase CwlO-like protein